MTAANLTRSILDHGNLTLVEHWGSDERIVEAARMSTAKGFLGWGPREVSCPRCGMTAAQKRDEAVREGRARPKPCDSGKLNAPCDLRSEPGDEKLLSFLYDHHHATPFEMAGAIVEVKAPIFVFREWHRHRVPFSYNEMSARYTPLPDENYIPSVERLMVNSKTNKQAGTAAGAEELTLERAERFRDMLADVYAHDERMYQEALKWGVPKELARVHLPVGRYSRMRASSNLRGWLNFLALRSDANLGAQWEIRQYANALRDVLADIFPRTMELFNRAGAAP